MKQNENENKKYEYFIYKIYNPECDYVYVGSTRSMKVRKSCHKSRCNNPNDPKYNYKVYKTIRDNGGFENFHIVVLEIMPDVTKLTAEIQEDVHRVKLNAKLNSRIATRGNISVEQYHKQYRNEHKESIQQYNKQYNIQNKEQISEKSKQYYIQNKTQINQKYYCECSGKYTNSSKNRHNKTNKHQKYISNLNN